MRTLILSLAGMLAAHSAMAGGIDTSFGTNGLVTFDPGTGASTQVHAAILQADGKIVAVGTSPAVPYDGDVGANEYVDTTRDFLILRFNSDGTVDSTFGTAGLVRVDFNGDDDRATGVVQQPDGKLVVVGAARSTRGDFDYAVARLNADGSLDPSFATGGKFTLNQAYVQSNGPFILTETFADNVGSGVALLSDGSIAVAGNLAPVNLVSQSTPSVQVFRLTPNGTMDSTYNPAGGGFALAGTAPFSAMTAASDGTLTVLGHGVAVELGADGATYLGSYPVSLSSPTEELLACYPQTDGTLLLGGGVFVSSSNPFGYQLSSLVTHLDASFKPDPAFATNGTATNFAGAVSNTVISLVTEPSGNIVAVGATVLDSDPLGREVGMAIRLRPNGTPDTNFGTNGITDIDFDAVAKSYSFIPTTVLRDRGGKIIVVGNSGTLSATYPEEIYINGTSAIALARLNSTPEYSLPPATSPVSVSESAGSATLQITRAGATAGPVSIDYTTVDGSAVAGTDYAATSGTVTWQPSDPDVKSISIPIIDVHAQGSDKQFTVRLSNPTEGTIVAATTTVSIKQDDAPAAPTSPPASPPASGGGSGGGAIDWLTCLGLAYIGVKRRRSGGTCGT